jgi:hypothetical protein
MLIKFLWIQGMKVFFIHQYKAHVMATSYRYNGRVLLQAYQLDIDNFSK